MKPQKEEIWPTPRARDWKDGYEVPPSVGNTRSHTLGTKVQEEKARNTDKGTLNPAWVEVYLMGYPPGWTKL